MFNKSKNRLRIPGPIFKSVFSQTEKYLVTGTPAVAMSDFTTNAKVSELSGAFMASLCSQKAAIWVEGGLRQPRGHS